MKSKRTYQTQERYDFTAFKPYTWQDMFYIRHKGVKFYSTNDLDVQEDRWYCRICGAKLTIKDNGNVALVIKVFEPNGACRKDPNQ